MAVSRLMMKGLEVTEAMRVAVGVQTVWAESVVPLLATVALEVAAQEVKVVRTQRLHFDHYSALVVVGCTHNQSY